MLQRQFRLPAATRLASAQFFRTPFFTLKVAKNTLDYNRFGFVVPKRVAKQAVARNRTKRKIRACIEQMVDQFAKGYDFVFILRKDLSDDESTVICKTVVDTLKQGEYLL